MSSPANNLVHQFLLCLTGSGRPPLPHWGQKTSIGIHKMHQNISSYCQITTPQMSWGKDEGFFSAAGYKKNALRTQNLGGLEVGQIISGFERDCISGFFQGAAVAALNDHTALCHSLHSKKAFRTSKSCRLQKASIAQQLMDLLQLRIELFFWWIPIRTISDLQRSL